LVLACGLGFSGCASAGAFTWFSELPVNEWASPPGDYVLGVGDSIDIKVYDQENLSMQGKVREDGRIAMPFVGETVAAGKQPSLLAREIEQRLKEFIVSPRVTVNVTDSVPITVSVLGEVASRGALSLKPQATLLQALAQSGGLTEFADEDSIYLLRKTPTFRRIRFKYQDLVRNSGGAAMFLLRSGDVIVVE
jgi:polysaccharide export outer membrane protein